MIGLRPTLIYAPMRATVRGLDGGMTYTEPRSDHEELVLAGASIY